MLGTLERIFASVSIPIVLSVHVWSNVHCTMYIFGSERNMKIQGARAVRPKFSRLENGYL